MKQDCIFCKIAGGEIPSYTLYEDSDFRVILDISPASNGHTIIIPKEHAQNVYELSEELASKVFVIAKKTAEVLSRALQCDGMNILQNNGETAGQTVFHFHMHVIPRYKTDRVTINWTHEDGSPDKDQLEKLAERLKKNFS